MAFHRSCDPDLLQKAEAQALKDRAAWAACSYCDSNGISWRRDMQPPVEVEDPCGNCAGYRRIYSVNGSVPKWNVPEMADRYNQKIRR